MNAWTSVFVVSTVSDDLTCRSWRSWKKHARQSEATWSDMLSWLSMVTPRFVTDPEKLTLAPRSCNSLTDSLFSCCLVPSHNSWVLSAFILSRLLLIHASIRSTHEVKRCTMVDADRVRVRDTPIFRLPQIGNPNPTTNDVIWAGEQEDQKLKNRHEGWQLHLYGDTPPLNLQLPNLA